MAVATKFPRLQYDPGTGTVNIDFESVLASDDKFDPVISRRDAVGGAGRLQSNFNYLERRLDAEFQLVTETIREEVDTMMEDHAAAGGTVRFFPDKDVPGTYFDVTIMNKRVSYRRQWPGLDYYTFTLQMREVIS